MRPSTGSSRAGRTSPGLIAGVRPSLLPTAASPFILASLILALPILDGCSSQDATTADRISSLPHLTAVADARIGNLEDPDLGFSRVSGIDVDRDGNVYILEALVPEIRVYRPDGVLLRRIGRRGGGPGEFENPPRFGILGDTLWTVENQAKRITLFDLEGAVLSTGRQEDVLVPLPSGFGYVLPWLMRPDGQFSSHFARVAFSRDDPETGVKPTDRIPVPFVLFDPSGAVTDTVGWADRPPPRMWRPPSQASDPPKMIDVGGGRVMVPAPPTTLPWWLPLLDGYLLVETPLPENGVQAEISLTRVGLQGDTIYHRVLQYSPVPYTSEDLDSISVRAARGEPGGMAPYVPGRGPPPDWEVVARRLRAAMEFPEFQLPIEYPWLATDEGIWMRQNDEGVAETVSWVLIEPGGEPRGVLELPADLQIRWNRGDTFWAVDPDEYGVPWVVRYRIRPAG